MTAAYIVFRKTSRCCCLAFVVGGVADTEQEISAHDGRHVDRRRIAVSAIRYDIKVAQLNQGGCGQVVLIQLCR